MWIANAGCFHVARNIFLVGLFIWIFKYGIILAHSGAIEMRIQIAMVNGNTCRYIAVLY